ncbi:hypothetical protein [Lentzea sp. NEAU-D7]|uniref:hypothetical protein n=1 Tax=Lentzea sp. NEAU-D7 TaxID=2994667 RepID=UPI00224A658F|nr:hypothetical protein [Lentzea sp. NEAU-D7]MCX2949757.1 hypothetical protein [Lentzea sp. NEAU-D7]
MGDERTRPYVLLAPCYGNTKTRRRYHKTIEASIDFESNEHRELPQAPELAALRDLHPSGRAHCWGAIATHDRMMDRLRIGDVVVFTGDNKVKAAGEVGYLVRNQPLADRMWDQFDSGRSFVNVYSVRNIRVIERPQREVWRRLGFDEGDNAAGQRLVTDERAERILTELQIATVVTEARISAELTAINQALTTGSYIIPVENFHIDVVSQHVAERNAQYDRVESQLVSQHQHFHTDVVFTSFRTHNDKRADLYRVEQDEVEIVEAKSLANHEKVREATAQSLDYSAQSRRPVTRLSPLFPLRLAQYGIDYLHRLGIDCIYRSADGSLVRDAAPDTRRAYMHPVWRAGTG